MENKEKTQNAGIDKDVLDVMKKTDTDINLALGDDKLTKRLILNCFCEFLSEIKKLRQDFDDFMNTVSICSADKLQSFFKELQTNVSDEKTRLNVQEKVKQSHKKSTKSVKKSTKDVK